MNTPWEWLGLEEAVEAWSDNAHFIRDFSDLYPHVENQRFAVVFTGTDDHPGEDLLYARGEENGIDTIWQCVGYDFDDGEGDENDPEYGNDWKKEPDQEAIKWEADGTKDAAKALLRTRLK